MPGSGLGPDVDVRWQLAADPRFGALVAEGSVSTGAVRDHTVKVEVRGLAAGTAYWYRFGYAGSWSPPGRTSTAPAPSAAVQRLR